MTKDTEQDIIVRQRVPGERVIHALDLSILKSLAHGENCLTWTVRVLAGMGIEPEWVQDDGVQQLLELRHVAWRYVGDVTISQHHVELWNWRFPIRWSDNVENGMVGMLINGWPFPIRFGVTINNWLWAVDDNGTPQPIDPRIALVLDPMGGKPK